MIVTDHRRKLVTVNRNDANTRMRNINVKDTLISVITSNLWTNR